MQASIAYLVSAYPAASHVFILREVLGLRARGEQIYTLSINADTRPAASLSRQELAERHTTTVIKNWSRAALLLDVLKVGLRCRGQCLAALWQSWQLAKPGWRGHLYSIAYWLEAMLVCRFMQQHQISHLHVHFGNEAALVGVLCKTIVQCQLSLTIHGPDEFFEVRTQQLGAKIAAADLIVCISQFARSQLMRIAPVSDWCKMRVIRLGISSRYGKASSEATTAPERAPNPSAGVVLCVGRLSSSKGQRVLLQAMKRLADRAIYPQLILAGAGEEEPVLRQMACALGLEPQVKFLGAVNADTVQSLYQHADVFVLPSFAEGIPVVLMEAMASGVPCISTQITGIPELIENYKTGLLISAGDDEALSHAIATLLQQPAYRQQLASAARHTISQSYNLERNLDQLADCFRAFRLGVHHA